MPGGFRESIFGSECLFCSSFRVRLWDRRHREVQKRRSGFLLKAVPFGQQEKHGEWQPYTVTKSKEMQGEGWSRSERLRRAQQNRTPPSSALDKSRAQTPRPSPRKRHVCICSSGLNLSDFCTKSETHHRNATRIRRLTVFVGAQRWVTVLCEEKKGTCLLTDLCLTGLSACLCCTCMAIT